MHGNPAHPRAIPVRFDVILLVCGLGAMSGARVLAAVESPPRAEHDPVKQPHGTFTGDVKIVFYVHDVQKSVKFYRDVLGFTFHHFHDYESGESVKEWTRANPPIYAEMSFAGRRFGLHLPQNDWEKQAVGKLKIYFRVNDLEAHHRRVEALGGNPSPLKKRPWMDMFRVSDPDGHRLYFAFTQDDVHGNPWSDRKDDG